ncbi:MAG: LPS export ABC transporter periplasmic protein LptC [Bacteroidota bacterium]
MNRHFFNSSICVLFFILALCLTLQSCENDKEQIAVLTKPYNGPIEKIEKLETIYSDSGIIKVKVTAPLLKKFIRPKPITELPAGINIDFYNERFQVVSKLTARYAIHYEQERKWVAKTDVVVVNEKNEQLKTEKLEWNEETGKLYSDEFVKITTPEETIMGYGFEADQNFNSYKIFKVTGIITVKQ